MYKMSEPHTIHKPEAMLPGYLPPIFHEYRFQIDKRNVEPEYPDAHIREDKDSRNRTISFNVGLPWDFSVAIGMAQYRSFTNLEAAETYLMEVEYKVNFG